MLTHVDTSWSLEKNPSEFMCLFGGRHGSSIYHPGWSCWSLWVDCHVTNQDVFLATSLGIVLKAQTISTCKLSSESRQGSWSQGMGILETLPKPFQNPGVAGLKKIQLLGNKTKSWKNTIFSIYKVESLESWKSLLLPPRLMIENKAQKISEFHSAVQGPAFF